jgi:ABC-type antimicrobial peptide transport system permease subunit
MEVVMGFSDTVTAGEAIGVGAAVIVLLPLALLAIVIGAAAGTTGSFKKN